MHYFSPLLHAMQFLVAPLLIGVTLIAGLGIVASRAACREHVQGSAALMMALSLLGGMLGVIVGNSSSALSESLVTGVLGVVTLFLTYLLGKDAQAGLRALAPYAMLALLAASFAGLLVGSNYKAIRTRDDVRLQRWDIYYKEVLIPMCQKEMLHALQDQMFPENYQIQCNAITDAIDPGPERE